MATIPKACPHCVQWDMYSSRGDVNRDGGQEGQAEPKPATMTVQSKRLQDMYVQHLEYNIQRAKHACDSSGPISATFPRVTDCNLKLAAQALNRGSECL